MLAGITDMVEANRFLKEVFLPQHKPASRPRPRTGAPPSSPSADILCIHEERITVRQARHFSPPAATAAITSRLASTNTPHKAVFHGPRCLARYHADGQPIDSQTREAAVPLRRDRPVPCGQVDSRSATDHFPTGPETATEAVNSYGTCRPVNSECSRHRKPNMSSNRVQRDKPLRSLS